MSNRLFNKQFLKAAYRLNGAKSSTGLVKDFSGKGNHGTLSGTEAYVETEQGKQMQQFSNSPYITIPNSRAAMTGNYTAMVKVKYNDLTTGQTFFAKGTGTTSEMVIDLSNGVLRAFAYDQNGARIASENGAAFIDREIILTAVKTTTDIYFYIDKNLVGNFTANSAWKTSTNPAIVGGRGSGSLSRCPESDCYVWENIALTQSEISEMVDHINNPPKFAPKQTPSLTTDGIDDYIDTGIIPDNNTEVKIWGSYITNTGDTVAIGTRNLGTTDSRFYPLANQGIGAYFNYGWNTYIDSSKEFDTKYHKFTLNSLGFYIDGVKSGTVSEELTIQTKSIMIGCASVEGTLKYFAPFLYNKVEIWQSGILIRHFKPLSDGTFIDTVNNVIYSNGGTGDLVYKQEALNLTNDVFTPASLTNDGINDYIDTGIIPNSKTKIEIVFRYITATDDDNIFGSGQSAAGNQLRIVIYSGNIIGLWGRTGVNFGAANTKKHTLIMSVDGYIIDGGELTAWLDSSMNDGQSDLIMFAQSLNDGQVTRYANGAIYKLNIWDDGVLVRAFRPQTDGTMLDVVNNVSYGNDGTGDLVYSPPSESSSLIFSTRDGVKDLTGKNTITNVDTIVGKGMVFNGTTSELSIPKLLSSTDATQTYTFKTVFTHNNDNIGDLMSQYSGGVNRWFMYILTERITWFKDGTATGGTVPILPGVKYHVIVTKSSTGVLKLYVNGELDKTFTDDKAFFDTNFALGHGSNYLDGKIYATEIYNEAKSADWVKNDYEKEIRYW